MNGAKNDVVRPSDNTNKTGVNGFEQFERDLSKGFAMKMGGNFHYDELIRVCKSRNIIYGRVKPVRSEDGKIDVVRTFMEARKIKSSSRGGI